MKIKPFAVEKWMNAYETGARYNIAETCVDSVSIDELFELCGEDKDAFFRELSARRLTYGSIFGKPEFKEGVAKLFRGITPEQIVTTHGAAGANHHVFYSLVEPGDRVISIMPTYQQLYSIPEGYGADVQKLDLTPENGYLPDLEQLRALAVPGTKLICVNNPNKEQRVSIQTALRMATYNGYYTTFDEKERGSLEPGKIADMVILSANPYEVPQEEIKDLKVESLILRGKPYESAREGVLKAALRGIFSNSKF